MQHKLISIIIPMYNEANNIHNCLAVLLSQSSQNFHVVFIDDGSTDNTYLLLVEALENYNIEFSYTILRQNNSGASEARRLGVESCETEYVMLFDCDDLLSDNFIEETMETIKTDKYDISMPSLNIQNSKNSYASFIFFTKSGLFSGLDSLKNSLAGWKVHGVICCKKYLIQKSYSVYRKYNINNDNYINNDEVITRLNFYHAQKVIRNDGVYFYQNNSDSTTKKINSNRYLMCKNAIIIYQLFGKNMGHISLNAQIELVSVLWGTVRYAIKHREVLGNIPEWKEEIKNTQDFISKEYHAMSLPIKSKVQLALSRILYIFI